MKQLRSLGVALLLSGCSIFPAPTPQTQYTLSAPTPNLESLTSFSPGLMMKVPSTDASLNTAQIAVSPTSGTRTYIEGAVWTDRAPLVVQDILIQGLENSSLFPNLGRSGSGVSTPYVLQSELRDFSVHYEGETPVVKIDLFAKLFSLKERKVLDAKRFSKTIPVSKSSLPALRAGFQEGFDQMVPELIQWLVVQKVHSDR